MSGMARRLARIREIVENTHDGERFESVRGALLRALDGTEEPPKVAFPAFCCEKCEDGLLWPFPEGEGVQGPPAFCDCPRGRQRKTEKES